MNFQKTQLRLLSLIAWVEVKYEQFAKFSIQIGRRAALVRKHYIPMTKIYFFDITSVIKLPIVEIAYNEITISLDLNLYPQKRVSTIRNQQTALHFSYELYESCEKLYEKYCKQKESEEKTANFLGLKSFVDSETDFVANYYKSQDIKHIRQAEIEQKKILNQLKKEILKCEKINVNFKLIILLVFFSLLIGYMLKILKKDHNQIWASHRIKKRNRGKKQRNNNF